MSNMTSLEVKAMKILVLCLVLFAIVGLAPCYIFGWVWLYNAVLVVSTVVTGAAFLAFLWAIILVILKTSIPEEGYRDDG